MRGAGADRTVSREGALVVIALAAVLVRRSRRRRRLELAAASSRERSVGELRQPPAPPRPAVAAATPARIRAPVADAAGLESPPTAGRRHAGVVPVALGCGLLAVAVALLALLLTRKPSTSRVSYGPVVSLSQHAGRPSDGFSQVEALQGALELRSTRSYQGAPAVLARYNGGGANGYARGLFGLDWRSGDEVSYSAAFYLPSSLFESMQGQVALMRLDDFPEQPRTPLQEGIVINGSDHLARLVIEVYRATAQTVLIGPFTLPRDRWFSLSVRQRLGEQGAASEVLLDGHSLGTSTAPNLPPGRIVQRVRYGLVAIHEGAQRRPLTLYFAAARASVAHVR